MFFFIQYWGFKSNPKIRVSEYLKVGNKKKHNFQLKTEENFTLNRNQLIVKNAGKFSEILDNFGIEYTQKGKALVSLCPFHDEKTPSFYVNVEKNVFYCFGCGASGNKVMFLKEIKSNKIRKNFVTKKEFSTYKNKFFGETENLRMVKNQKMSNLVNLKSLTSLQITWCYFAYLLHDNRKVQILFFLRGLSFISSQIFGVGCAPNGKNSLYNYLLKRQFSHCEIIESGLFFLRKNNFNRVLKTNFEKIDFFDMFRERMIIPIRNKKGIVIAFGGRIINSMKNPKYLNSSDWDIFKKKRILFSEEIYKNSFLTKPKISLLVEGYMDSLVLFQNGIRFSIAILGTAISPYQFIRSGIASYNNHIIFFFDSDFPGKRSTFFFFSKFGKFFKKDSLRLSVANIPEDHSSNDPDELSYFQGGKFTVNEILNKSRPIVLWVEEYIFHQSASPIGFLEFSIEEVFLFLKGLEGIDLTSFKLETFFVDLVKISISKKLYIHDFSLRKIMRENPTLSFDSNFYGIFHLPFPLATNQQNFVLTQGSSGKNFETLQKDVFFMSLYFSKMGDDIFQILSSNRLDLPLFIRFSNPKNINSSLFRTNLVLYSNLMEKFYQERMGYLSRNLVTTLIEQNFFIRNESLIKKVNKFELIESFLDNKNRKFLRKERELNLLKFEKLKFFTETLNKKDFRNSASIKKIILYGEILKYSKEKKLLVMKQMDQLLKGIEKSM